MVSLDKAFWGSDFGFPRSPALGQQQAEKQGWGSAESLGARSLFAFATFISVARGKAVGTRGGSEWCDGFLVGRQKHHELEMRSG